MQYEIVTGVKYRHQRCINQIKLIWKLDKSIRTQEYISGPIHYYKNPNLDAQCALHSIHCLLSGRAAFSNIIIEFTSDLLDLMHFSCLYNHIKLASLAISLLVSTLRFPANLHSELLQTVASSMLHQARHFNRTTQPYNSFTYLNSQRLTSEINHNGSIRGSRCDGVKM